MRVGKECFRDVELVAFYDLYGKEGTCGITKTKSCVIDITEIQGFLEALLCQFKPGIPLRQIAHQLNENWDVFKDDCIGEQILQQVAPTAHSIRKISARGGSIYMDHVAAAVNSWREFKGEIAWRRRFLISSMEYEWEDMLRKEIPVSISQEEHFYRARLHGEADVPCYDPCSMGAPPRELSTAGRANPSGIPYLYLCEQDTTTLYEVRALYLDEATIGTFQLADEGQPIKIIDFTSSSLLSLYGAYSAGDFPIELVMAMTLLKRAISRDLSKPIRRYDTEDDYIPTQFLCEYVRDVMGKGGIKYYSALRPGEANVVIFSPEKMRCTGVKKVRVVKSDMLHKECP